MSVISYDDTQSITAKVTYVLNTLGVGGIFAWSRGSGLHRIDPAAFERDVYGRFQRLRADQHADHYTYPNQDGYAYLYSHNGGRFYLAGELRRGQLLRTARVISG